MGRSMGGMEDASPTEQIPLALVAVCDRAHFCDMVALTAFDTETEHCTL
jgi:hypothetical protein